MSDDADEAQELAERERESARRAASEALEGDGRAACEACGEPISEGRRRAMPAATRCFDCQSRRERWRWRQFRRR